MGPWGIRLGSSEAKARHKTLHKMLKLNSRLWSQSRKLELRVFGWSRKRSHLLEAIDVFVRPLEIIWNSVLIFIISVLFAYFHFSS